MGRFSSTVHIKSNIDRTRFMDSFCDVMKKRGFEPCSEDKAALSYLLAFGKYWVTLRNEEYKNDPNKAYDDSQQIAEVLKTSAISVEVVDSDFAILNLFGANKDKVIVGDGSGYGIDEPPRGKREYWKPLIADGKTWEQFSEAAAKSEAFVEDALAELAKTLGINPYYICADFDDITERLDCEGKSVTALYFKKADAKNKAMSLNAAFVKVFGEALEPLGFKKIKSRYPYFVRVVPGGEIIHVITIISKQGLMQNEKAFEIRGGAATVYRGKIDFTVSPQRNSNWLISNIDVYYELHPFEDNSEMYAKIDQFTYTTGDDSSMTSGLVSSLGYTKQLLLPALDKITNLSEYADFYWKFEPTVLDIFDEEGWGIAKDNGQSDGLMLLTIYDTDTYENKSKEEIERFRARMLYAMKTGRNGYTLELLDSDCKIAESRMKIGITAFEKLLNDSQRNIEVLNELKHRKTINSGILSQIGLFL